MTSLWSHKMDALSTKPCTVPTQSPCLHFLAWVAHTLCPSSARALHVAAKSSLRHCSPGHRLPAQSLLSLFPSVTQVQALVFPARC